MLLGAGALFLHWQDAHSRVPQGVEVAGLPVAGMKTGEAEAAIAELDRRTLTRPAETTAW